MLILGVDPGISGALALYDAGAHRVVAVMDVPVVGDRVGAKSTVRLDPHAVNSWLTRHRAVENIKHAFVENAQVMPKQGAVSAFRYGRVTGALEATVALVGFPITLVSPVAWKRWFKLSSDKEAARARAIQLFPEAAEDFHFRRDHNKAEAALIALYGAKTMEAGYVIRFKESNTGDIKRPTTVGKAHQRGLV